MIFIRFNRIICVFGPCKRTTIVSTAIRIGQCILAGSLRETCTGCIRYPDRVNFARALSSIKANSKYFNDRFHIDQNFGLPTWSVI